MSDKNDFETTEVSMLKLVTQVQNWPRNRWKHLFVGIICLLLGLYMISDSVPSLFPNKSLLDKIQLVKKPEELSTELWLIAEVRRTVAYQEKYNQLLSLSLIECVIGIMMSCGACFLLLLLVIRWKDGGKEIQLARLLLECHKELEKNKSNIPT